MKAKILASISGIIVSLIAPLAILVPQVSAATDVCTWTGGGVDNKFGTTGNWSCSVDGAAAVPENGDSIAFDMSVPAVDNELIINDLVGLSVAGINMTGDNASSYGFLIEGNDLDVAGNITGDSPEGTYISINLNVTLAASISYSVRFAAIGFGKYDSVGTKTFNLGSNNLTFTTPSGCAALTFYSSLSGSGNIISNSGSDAINLRAAHSSFTGDITTNGDGVSVADGALGASTTITINGSGRLIFSDVANYASDVVMNSDSEYALISSNSGFGCAGEGYPATETTTLSGDLTLQRDTIFVGSPHNLNVTGVFTSNGHLLTTQTGSVGSITTSAGTVETEAVTTTIEKDDKSSAYLGVANKQTVVLNGERGYVSVSMGGILKGTGKTGTLDIDSGGILAPGLSPGCITSGNLSISGTYQVEIAGKTACSEYDQTDVTGTVTLSGVLETTLLNKFVPALNDTFVIINNDGSEAIMGTFDGLVEGASIEKDGVTFQISYKGGDGNDVVLTATAVPAKATAPDTGIGTILASPFMSISALLLAVGSVLSIRKLQTAKK